MADIKQIYVGKKDVTYDIKDEVARSTKQDKIDTVTLQYTEDGGTPDASVQFNGGALNFTMKNMKMKYSELTEEEKAQLVGPKGATGDSAVYDPSDPDTPDFVMANTTGQSTTKAMTQKAVTDALHDIELDADEVPVDIDDLTPLLTWWINQDKWQHGDISTNHGCKFLPVTPGVKYRITPSDVYENGCHCVFLQNDNHVAKSTPAYCTVDTGWHSEPYTAVAPSNAAYLYIRYLRGDVVVEPTSISEMHSTKLEDVLVDMEHDISSLEDDAAALDERLTAIENGEIEAKGIGKTDGIKLLDNGNTAEDAEWAVSDFIPCEEGDTVAVLYNKLKASTSCVHWYDENQDYLSAQTSNVNNSGAQLELTAPEGAAFLRLSYYTQRANIPCGIVAINEAVVWNSELIGDNPTKEDGELFISNANVKEYSGLGNDSEYAIFSFGKLVEGARYRLVIDDTTPFDSYRSTLTLNNQRLSLMRYYDDTNEAIYPGFKLLPTPSSIDFIAKTNTEYTFRVRATKNTLFKFKLVRNDVVDENLTINAAIYKKAGTDSANSLPYLKLLHYSDIHACPNAALRIQEAVEKYGSVLNDILFTGDVVYQRVGYEVGDAEFWEDSGLGHMSLFNLGNHDFLADNWQYVNVKSKAWCHDTYIAPYITELGYIMPTGYNISTSPNYKACFWHKDYADQKVRLIGLDAMHIFDGVVDPATGEITTAGTRGYGNEQEVWLVEKLAETLSGGEKEGWHVIVCGHLPLDRFDDTNSINKEWNETTHMFDCNMRGGRVVNQKTGEVSNWHSLDSVKWGTDSSFGIQFYDMYGTNNIANIINYYNNQVGSHFVVYLHGHHHKSMLYYPANYPNLLDFGIEQAGGRLKDSVSTDVETMGGYTANFLTFDLSKGLMKVVRLGMATDNFLTPRNYLTYDYINRKVISEG